MIRRTLIRNGPLKPIRLITDRAKRYRAHHPNVRPAAPKQCGYCGSRRNVDIDHINGRENDGAAENLMWGCRRCNTKKGIILRRAGLGTLTRQYNPAGRSKRALMQEYSAAIKVMRGEFEGDVSKAVATIRGTPRDIRSAFTARSWPVRRQLYGPSGRQGRLFGDDVPF